MLPEVTYAFAAGAGGTWTKGSSSGFDLVVNRSVDDDKTFSLFTGIEVDGAVIDAVNYTASSGSLNATIGAAYLETLSVGAHNLKVNFQDGSVEMTVTIEPAAGDDPSEDDNDNGDDNSNDNGNGTVDDNDNGSSSESNGNATSNTKPVPSTSSQGLAHTGDNLPIVLLAGIAAVAFAVVVGLLIARKARRR